MWVSENAATFNNALHKNKRNVNAQTRVDVFRFVLKSGTRANFVKKFI